MIWPGQPSTELDFIWFDDDLSCNCTAVIFGCGRSTYQGMGRYGQGMDKVWTAHAHTFDCSSLAEQSSAVMMCLQTSWSLNSWRNWFVTSSPGFKISQPAPFLTNVYTGNKTYDCYCPGKSQKPLFWKGSNLLDPNSHGMLAMQDIVQTYRQWPRGNWWPSGV